VDAGGTSTRALALAVPTGEARTAHAEGANWTVHGPQTCRARIEEAVREALPGGAAPAAVCLCIAGYYPPDHAAAAETWAHAAWPAARVRVKPDLAGARAGAFGGEPGIVVISGTGSVAFGRCEGGREARAGGWGPLFSDHGSAYAVALGALRLLADHEDGIRSAGALASRVLERWPALGTDLRSWLRGVYRCGWQREQIAQVASEVAAAAEAGDAVALGLMACAAADLLELAAAVARNLGDHSLPIALQGGMAGGILRRLVEQHLRAAGGPALIDARHSPLEGAVLLAAEALGGAELLAQVREKLP
jgi:N-acetylglucosamine kinase-like BadF-type ATPase